jgi:DNA helicase-2/ATP-dependent DNA helicase PcrA
LDTFHAVYGEPEIIELNTSYRSSFEIIQFAGRILNVAQLKPVERHGDGPRFVKCAGAEEEIITLKELIRTFRQGDGRSLGNLTKTHTGAKKLWAILNADTDSHLIMPESDSFQGGISVSSIRMSKGLEFDEVIVFSADRKTYHTEHDRHLLYIACTRAMHKLTLLYSGAPTPLCTE